MPRAPRFFHASLGLALATVLAAGTVQAHQAGDIILRLGAAGTHLNDDPYRDDDSWQRATGAASNADFNLKLKDDIGPALGVTWMFAHAFGVNVSWNSWHHNLRGRYHGTNPDWADYNGLNMARFQQQALEMGAVWYPSSVGHERIHPYVGFATIYTRVKSEIHRDWAALEHRYIDEDLAAGIMTATQARAEHQQWAELVDDSRIKDSDWGWKSQVGVDFSLTPQWLLNAQLSYAHPSANLAYWNWTLGAGFKF